jgi:lambda repressor-like predicted transcriptional regulator
MANDVTPMIPVRDELDEEIYAAWEAGKGMRALARQFDLSIVQVEQALDRMLPVFDPPSQLRAYKRELHSLEDLSREFFVIAKRDKDKEGAHLVARLNERICAMRGFSPANIRTDPLTVEVKQQPPRHEKIREVIERLTGRELQQPNDGNRRPLDDDSAVDALSPPNPDELGP